MKTWGFPFAIAFGGIIGAAIGFFAGGLIGALSCDWNTKEAGCIEVGAYGAIIGGSVLMPIGAQLAGRLRGSLPLFLLTLLTVGGIGAAGLVGASITHLEGIVLTTPVVQLISCVAIQHWAAGESTGRGVTPETLPN